MIPANLIHDSFNVPSLAGIGDLGLFDSTNVSTWGIGEVAAILIGGYLAVKFVGDVKNVGAKTLKATKRGRRKLSKAAVGGTSKIGTVVAVGALAGAGYIAYSAMNSQGGTQ